VGELMIKAILAALALIPTPAADRDRIAEKTAQQHAFAAAVAEFGRTPTERAFLVTLAKFESSLSLDVHVGACPPKRCDVDRNGVARARGPFQNWKNSMSDEEWSRMVGVENTRSQVARAAKHSRWALATCKGNARGAFVVLGGRRCDQSIPGIEKRVEFFNKALGRLQ
jgi:hypothetical protein